MSLGQRQSGEVVPAASVKHISHRRFLATFQLEAVSKAEQDLYRCVTQSARGAGVSNFAELIVKGASAALAHSASGMGHSCSPLCRGRWDAWGTGIVISHCGQAAKCGLCSVKPETPFLAGLR